jgi:hypothetical protein
MPKLVLVIAVLASLSITLLVEPARCRADALNDWNATANEIIVAARLPPPTAIRAAAIVQTAVYDAVNAITRRYPTRRRAPTGASIDAAVAAANRVALTELVSAQAAAIDAAYRAALAAVPDGEARSAGIAVGTDAAGAVLALRSDDGAGAAERYRPRTAAGAYVPTTLPAATRWPERRPWALARPDELRPGPPPDLKSSRWASDYNEIKALGARDSTRRTAEQTEIARFWEMTGAAIYFPIVRSVTGAPGRDVTESARLLAMAGQAMDDAAIAVFDAKYRYAFWRPITAIRNGDLDGNDATAPDPGWLPFIETPMHPEYPCAHCTIAAAVGAVLTLELAGAPMPRLTSTSATAHGAARSWDTVAAFVDEVARARIYDGVHYRTSTEVGTEMGQKVGAAIVKRFQAGRD